MVAWNGILLLLSGLGVVLAQTQYLSGEYTNGTNQSMDDVYESPDPSMEPSMEPSMDPSMAPIIEVYESPSMAPTIQEYSMSPTIFNETSNITHYTISNSTDTSTLFPSISPTASVHGNTKSAQYTMLSKKAFVIGAFALTILGGSFVVIYFYELCRPKNKMLQTSSQLSMNADAEWSSVKNERNNSVGDIESLEQSTDVTKLLDRSDSVVFNITGTDSAKYRTGHSRSNSKTGLLSENCMFGKGGATSQATTPNHSRTNSVTVPISLENDLLVPNPPSNKFYKR